MRIKLLFLGFIILNLGLKAQYAILPTPFKTVQSEGIFQYSLNHQIECYSRDSFLNASLNQWLKEEAANKVAPNKMVQTKLSLQLVGQKKWKQYLGKLLLQSSFEPGAEGYVIKIEKNSILLLAQTETALFYGFQTLKQLFQLAQIPCGEIYDKPSFAIRAWQDDISRGPIPTMGQLKEEIKRLSAYKLNYFTLYTEHVFKYQSHTDIAPNDGISSAEIMELERFAKLYHVELIANQQSFGHMEKILAKQAYSYLAEKQHILSPTQEGSYKLLADFYKEQVAAFKGKYIHINADETFGLGTEQSKHMADSMGLGNLYAYHINRIYDLLKPSGKQILMWSDIIGNYPEIKSKLPKDIILIPWAYHPANDFKPMLEPIAMSDFNFWVAPGINNWNNLYPNLEDTKTNCYNLIRDGYFFGATGVLNTSWDDDGYALFGNNWQGFIWGAELSWNAPLQTGNATQRWLSFEEAFDTQFWGIALSSTILKFAALHHGKLAKALTNEKFFEPIFPLYPEYIGDVAEVRTLAVRNELSQIYKQTDSLLSFAKKDNPSSAYLKYAIRQAQFSVDKSLFRIHYSNFLNQHYSKEKILEELDLLKGNLQNIRTDFSYLYLQENRTWWLDKNLKKLDNCYQDLEYLPKHCLINASNELTKKGREITLKAPLSENSIYYCTNECLPSFESKVYEKPIYIKENVQLSCASFASETERRNINTEVLNYHLGIGKIKKINIPYSKYNPAYSGGGPMALADGRIGDASNLSSGRWQGYSGNDLIIELDFGKATSIKELEMGFYQCTPSWVILPSELQIYESTDGQNYQLLSTLKHNIPVNSSEKIKYVFKQEFAKHKVSYIKVVAKYYGPLPAFHSSAGSASMIFADELIIK
ncbi:MAG: hypothetical protein CFE21_08345 [Bacteroidetes bacterium B1(2017)]|nr:MAG: hypothetical protein CFE21_08345 [Bacteroidetes bacterium B1(2017)]